MLFNLLREHLHERPVSQSAWGLASCPPTPTPAVSADTVPAAEDKDLTLDTGCRQERHPVQPVSEQPVPVK